MKGSTIIHPAPTTDPHGALQSTPKPTIAVLSAESGAGKTTVCRKVIALAQARSLSVAGVLTLPNYVFGHVVGLEVQDSSTGNRRPLASLTGLVDGIRLGRWYFYPNGLAWGDALLRAHERCDLWLIDELGPLELVQGKGWVGALDALRTGAGFRLALVVVRPLLLQRFHDALCRPGLPPAAPRRILTVNVTAANRDALPGRIVHLLRETL